MICHAKCRCNCQMPGAESVEGSSAARRHEIDSARGGRLATDLSASNFAAL
jgi:hypothetical protein